MHKRVDAILGRVESLGYRILTTGRGGMLSIEAIHTRTKERFIVRSSTHFEAATKLADMTGAEYDDILADYRRLGLPIDDPETAEIWTY